MASEHPELRIDDNSRDAIVAHGERSYSLFVDAS
jgi:hypothetical protein